MSLTTYLEYIFISGDFLYMYNLRFGEHFMVRDIPDTCKIICQTVLGCHEMLGSRFLQMDVEFTSKCLSSFDKIAYNVHKMYLYISVGDILYSYFREHLLTRDFPNISKIIGQVGFITISSTRSRFIFKKMSK